MRRLVLRSVAIIVCAAANSAGAADLPVKAPAIAPAWSWTGCYVGANAGGTRLPTTVSRSRGSP